MLINFITHLKNVIFFKLVMYFLGISSILILLQVFNQDYQYSIKKTYYTEELLAQETLNLYSIKNSEHKILDTYVKYKDLLSMSSKEGCLERTKLMDKIIDLSTKYHLNEPITITIKQEFPSKIKPHLGEEKYGVKIRSYDLKIKFATQDFLTFGQIIREIYANMPENTIILSIEVQKEDVLEPDTIYKLSIHKIPDMIFAKLTMRIRELAL
ncbi:MAG: hypothetical protein LN588_03500 [Rickettsia endosymbiont of Bryobia graminum]|nr:hypothetical protein [Rickettsia endosymbiont of Bryobia graminum]